MPPPSVATRRHNDRSCASRIHWIPTTLTRSSVHLVGGPPTPRLPQNFRLVIVSLHSTSLHDARRIPFAARCTYLTERPLLNISPAQASPQRPVLCGTHPSDSRDPHKLIGPPCDLPSLHLPTSDSSSSVSNYMTWQLFTPLLSTTTFVCSSLYKL
ncbi:hypothetical protein PYW07_008817 [Mythimna separata]|uniref:Uncharacterized protein n=1 Tax=Mythimna separata TaxID=271217 RepID=A0AAD7YAR0_MYTSE|nr:hypothetical protein PYW07_008817 [Mythimna separata]